MKKLCILASVALMGITSANAQARIGLIGGVNLNNQLDHYQGETTSNQLKTGWHIGMLNEFCIAPNWTIQPGVMYILKGGEQQRSATYMANDGMHDVKIKDKMSLHYIEVPVTLNYRIKAGSGHVMIGAGGYVSGLVSAYTNYKYKESLNGNELDIPNSSGTKHLKVGDHREDDLRRWDFGVTGLIGYEFHNGFFLRGAVDAGLQDIVKANNTYGFASSLPSTAGADPTSKNISYLFSIGYYFAH